MEAIRCHKQPPGCSPKTRSPFLISVPTWPDEQGALDRLGRELYRASTEVGFYYLKNHGIPQSLIDQTFVEAKRFHALSLEEKRKIKVDHNKIGYFEVESTITRHSNLANGAKPNLYAAFCMRRELPPDDPDILAGVPYRALNRWPENLPGFRENIVAYSEAMEALGKKTSAHLGAGARSKPRLL